jgi:hypothetical protein
MKKTLTVLALCSFIGFAGQAQALSFTTFTSFDSWKSAFAPTLPLYEGFDDLTLLSGFSITENGSAGVIESSHYANVVDEFSDYWQEFNYAPGMTAFGGYFDLDPNGIGSGIDMSVGGSYIMTAGTNGFFGFVADGSFNTVRFTETGSGIETYYAVDLHLAPVPEPTTMLLFGAGLAGLAGLSRRKK